MTHRCIFVTVVTLQGSTSVHVEHPKSWAAPLQFPVLQSRFRYSHLSEDPLLVNLAHCPALPDHSSWICHSRKLHLAGECIAHVHAEESCAAVVGAGEVEINVYEVGPDTFGHQRVLVRVKHEVASYWRTLTIMDWGPVHGGGLQLACRRHTRVI